MEGLAQPIRHPQIKYTKLFINNEWVESVDGSTFSVYNPTTTEVICEVSEAKEADVNIAVAAAKDAFVINSEWRRMKPSQRSVLINRLADLLERDRRYISSLESLNNGKIYSRVYSGDLARCIETFRYYAGWATKHQGKTIPVDGDFLAFTRHDPLGVCGAITPWNVPLIMLAWKTAPCLATGNTMVLKPTELTPLTALYFASLVKEVGFPAGVFNVVPGYGKTAGSALTHHMDVAKISFTGSLPVGRMILKAAADSNIKKVTLEMGGKNPLIVCSDVDIDQAVETAHSVIFCQGGQVCCAGSKTYVHEDIYEEFVAKSVKRAKSRKLGDPFDLTVEQGPQISEEQQEKVLAKIRAGVKEGCTLRCGGEKLPDNKGHFITPAVMTDVADETVTAKEEIFGPVQLIFKFKTIEEVIRRCNRSVYGLAAGVMTNDINKAMAVAKHIEAGIVWVNCYFQLNPGAPFGGYKQSGIGRDLGEYALNSFTETKTVYIKEPSLCKLQQ